MSNLDLRQKSFHCQFLAWLEGMPPRSITDKMAYEMEDAVLDYETEQPLYFEPEIDEDFYDDINLSKDLFKKFELLPTPPGSPQHEPEHEPLGASVDKRWQLVSQILDENDPLSRTMIFPDLNTEEWSNNLSSKLIQDCMWSAPGLAAAGLISIADLKNGNVPQSPTSPAPKVAPLEKSKTALIGIDVQSSTQCVDPAAVFPYPVSKDTPKKSWPAKVSQPSISSCGSFAETPSPSESEDEEIDVVTVDKARRQHRTAPVYHKPVSFSAHVATMHNYSNTNCPASYSAPQSPSSSSSSHHCQKRSRPVSMPASPQLVCKRQKSLVHTADLKKVVQKLKVVPSSSHSDVPYQHCGGSSQSSQNSSDSEDGYDGNKRAQHNVLERKRRNDLKYSFMRVKEHIPELDKTDRAAKVVILRKAGEHIRELQQRNIALLKEQERQQRLHEHWKRRLSQLRRECY